jgi:JNK1/MAPK8-associated membrane protein
MILILPMFIHSFCIDNFAYMRRFPKAELILHFCAFTEVILAAMLTVLLTEPTWSFSINSCGVQRLSDWYTLFFNPSPRYESKSLHCTQEAVYPLQTMVLVFYLLCTLLMVILRPTLNSRYLPGSGKMAVYYALYIFPILSLLHVCFGGLIYFAFPYLSIIISVVTNAIHFSLKLDQGMKALFMSCGQFRNMIIICEWLD